MTYILLAIVAAVFVIILSNMAYEAYQLLMLVLGKGRGGLKDD